MALTISIATLKGGVGKSTIAINVATYLHQEGHKVLIVDGDSQGTCQGWAAIAANCNRDTPPVVSMGAEMRRDLERVAEGFDVVVIDTPPRLGAEQRAAMLSSDLILVPVTPGPADVWALKETLDLLSEARDYRPELTAAIVLNRINPRTALASVTRGAIETASIPALNATLCNRVAFGEAMATGQGVVSYAPNSTATAEIKALTQEAMELVASAQERKAG